MIKNISIEVIASSIHEEIKRMGLEIQLLNDKNKESNIFEMYFLTAMQESYGNIMKTILKKLRELDEK